MNFPVNDDEILDDELDAEYDQRNNRKDKIQSLRPQTNFDKFDTTAIEDLKERTGSIFSAEREPRKTIQRKTIGSSSMAAGLLKSRSPT